jgi:hypothetical protein
MTRTPTRRLRTVAVAAVLAFFTVPVVTGTADAAIDPCALLHRVVAPAIPGSAPTVPGPAAPGSTPQSGGAEPTTPTSSAAPADDQPGAVQPTTDQPSTDQPSTDQPDDGSGAASGDDHADDSSGDGSDEGHPAAAPAVATPAPDVPAPTAAPAVPAAPAASAAPGASRTRAAAAPAPATPAAAPGGPRAAADPIPPGVLGATAPLPVVCHPGSDRPYFGKADWLWGTIPPNPVLDSGSAGMVAGLATGEHIANIGDFGVTLRGPDGITAATPRFPVSFSETGNWGPDPFGGRLMPIPPGTPIAPGSDGHLAVADPITNAVYNLWMAKDGGAAWTAGWGSITPLDGDGRELNGSSTGAGIARFAAVVREAELAAGVIPHALFFSTNMAAPAQFRYPATKTDGSNDDGMPNPIPEGARVQLDPSLDVDALPNLTPAEKTVAKALQTYGAYCGDNGGARMAFLFEYAPDKPGYAANGLTGSFASLENIPFDKLRVLASWDGRAPDENPLQAAGHP